MRQFLVIAYLLPFVNPVYLKGTLLCGCVRLLYFSLLSSIMTKKAKLLFWFIPLVAVHCARLPRPEKEGDLIQDLLGIQSLQDDGKSDSDKQPLPPTEVPPPTMPPMKSATITTATPPTPPTPGVVTVTSAPSHDNKYMKKIERLLFAIL